MLYYFKPVLCLVRSAFLGSTVFPCFGHPSRECPDDGPYPGVPAPLPVRGSASPARGLGDDIRWRTLKEALWEAKETSRPVMIVILKSGCEACTVFKPRFAASDEIGELSEHFVMVNLLDDEEPGDKALAPDGRYVPRILFLSPSGRVEPEFINKLGNPSTRYFYPNARSVAATMRDVLKKYPPDEYE